MVTVCHVGKIYVRRSLLKLIIVRIIIARSFFLIQVISGCRHSNASAADDLIGSSISDVTSPPANDKTGLQSSSLSIDGGHGGHLLLLCSCNTL